VVDSIPPAGDLRGSGVVPGRGVRRLGRNRWERRFDASLSGPPAVAGDWVLVGDDAGRLHALDARDGDPRWTTTHDRVSSPPVVADDIVYIGIGNERLHSCDLATGAEQWTSEPLRAQSQYPSESAPTWPIVAGDLVICRTWDSLCALDRGSGALRWSTDGYTNGSVYPPTVVAGLVLDATVVAGTDGSSASVNAVNLADGRDAWQYGPDEERDQRQVSPSRLAEHGGRLYTFEMSLTRPYGWLIELDPATGLTQRTVPLPPGLVSYHPPAVVDGTVWFGSVTLGEYVDDPPMGAVLCRADGDRVTVVAELAGEPAGQPLVAGGVLYLATGSGVLHAFDTATGQQLWSFDTGRPADSFLGPFHAVGDGVVYAGVKNGVVALAGDE